MKYKNHHNLLLALGALAAAGLSSVPAFAALEVFEVRGMGKGLRDTENPRVQPVTHVYSEIIPPSVPGAPWLLKHGGTASVSKTRYGYVSADGKTFITKPEFSAAEPFRYSPKKNLYAIVNKDGKWNYIDEKGYPVFARGRSDRKTLLGEIGLADFYLTFRKKHGSVVDPNESYSGYVKKRVECALGHFILRGAFEGKAAYSERVNENTIRSATKFHSLKAREGYFARHTPKSPPIPTLPQGGVDLDSETAQISVAGWGTFRVKMPMGAEAARFTQEFAARRAKIEGAKYDLVGDVLKLTQFTLVVDGKAYPVDNSRHFASGGTAAQDAKLMAQITAEASSASKTQLGGSGGVMAGSASDVDMDIPLLKRPRDKKRFALVIANEQYDKDAGMKNVAYARRDGEVVAQYFRDVLGAEVTRWTNLTGGKFPGKIKDFCRLLKTNPGAEAYFYYAGHAVAGSDGVARLLPTDASSESADEDGSTVNVADCFRRLGETEASRIVVFFDSCYSGGKDMTDARGASLAPRTVEMKPAPNMIVLSASTATQVSQPYAEGSHGLFTYFLLKKLKETKGAVSVNELFNYVRKNVELVSNNSVRYRLQEQTPTLMKGGKADTGAPLRLKEGD